MATKLTVSIIFLLLTLAYAESELEFPQRDVAVIEDRIASPQFDSNIFLPSQKTEPESREIEPEITKPVDAKTDETESVPVTIVTFRPINRHFRQGPLLPLRHGRRCGGFGRRGMMKPWLMREIPYGNDMVGVKEGDAAEHGGEMPLKIERFGHGRGRFDFGGDIGIIPVHRFGRNRPHHRFHHRFHVEEEEENEHKHHDEEDDEEEHHHHHHHHHHGGFLRRIRKFFHHF